MIKATLKQVRVCGGLNDNCLNSLIGLNVSSQLVEYLRRIGYDLGGVVLGVGFEVSKVKARTSIFLPTA